MRNDHTYVNVRKKNTPLENSLNISQSQIRISQSRTHSISTWQSCIRAQMISTAKVLINSNNPNILIQLYTSENDFTTNGQVRCYRHKF